MLIGVFALTFLRAALPMGESGSAYQRGLSEAMQQLAKVTGASIPDDQKRMILRENLRNLLLPILQAKGMKS